MDEFRDIADFNLDGEVDAFESALFFEMMEEEDQEIERSLKGRYDDDEDEDDDPDAFDADDPDDFADDDGWDD